MTLRQSVANSSVASNSMIKWRMLGHHTVKLNISVNHGAACLSLQAIKFCPVCVGISRRLPQIVFGR